VNRRRPGTLVSALLLASISVFPAFLIGAVSVQLRADLGLDRAQLGTAVSAFFISAAFTVARIGRLVDRIGERRSFLLGSGLAFLSLLFVATLARGWLTLALSLAVGGIGNAVVGPASSRILAHAIDPARRGWAFGVKQAAIMGATLLGGVGVPLIALQFGWRWVYALSAVLAAGVMAIAPPDVERPPTTVGSGRMSQRRPTLILLAVAFGLGTSASVAMTTFLVDYTVSSGVGEARAATLLATGSVIVILLRLILGWWCDHGLTAVDSVIAGLFVLGAVAVGLLPHVPGGPVLVGISLLAFTGVWGWTGLLVYFVAVRNLRGTGAAAGILQTGAATGGILGPSLMGAIAERVSYTAMWSTSAMLLLLASGAMAAARSTERPLAEERATHGGA
jgi:predicted MFS family arabinose efflux permease